MDLRMPNPKILLAILAVSLLANVVLLSRGGSHASRQAMMMQGGPAGLQNVTRGQLEAMLRKLPPPRRKELKAGMAKEYGQLQAQAEAVGRVRGALAEDLKQPQIDVNAVNQRLTEIRTAQNAASETAQQMMVTVLSKLTPEERAEALRPGPAAPRQGGRKHPPQGQK